MTEASHGIPWIDGASFWREREGMSLTTSNVFPAVVRLRPGRQQRNLHVSIFSDLEEPDRIAPPLVLEAFVNGVEEGLFGNVTITGAKRAVKVLPEQGLTVDTLTACLSGLAPEALVVLPNMVRSSVRGLKRLEILEDHPNERALVVRTLLADAEATIADLDFPVALNKDAGPHVQVVFLEVPTDAAIERFEGLVQAWVRLVRLGAYPPPGEKVGGAEWVETTVPAPEVRLVRFEGFVGGVAAYEALLGALGEFSEEVPIAHVTVG